MGHPCTVLPFTAVHARGVDFVISPRRGLVCVQVGPLVLARCGLPPDAYARPAGLAVEEGGRARRFFLRVAPAASLEYREEPAGGGVRTSLALLAGGGRLVFWAAPREKFRTPLEPTLTHAPP